MTKSMKSIMLSFRVSADEYEAWERARKAKGIKFRSRYIRECVNSDANCLAESSDLSELTLHMKRFAAGVSEIQSDLARADNDNSRYDQRVAELLQEAMTYICQTKKATSSD